MMNQIMHCQFCFETEMRKYMNQLLGNLCAEEQYLHEIQDMDVASETKPKKHSF
jgi:hypothetical protein